MRIIVICAHYKEFSLGTIYPRIFREIGHEVLEFYDIPEMENESAIFKLPIFKRINGWRVSEKHTWGIRQKAVVNIFRKFMDKAEIKANKKLIEVCNKFKPEVLFVIKGKAILKSTLVTIKDQKNCILTYYNADDHFNLYSTSRNMLNSLPVYDIVFTWSHALFKSLYKAGARKVEFLPFGYDKVLHTYEDSSDDINQFSHDIVFVGEWDKKRENMLSVLADLDLGIWGPRWNRASRKSPSYKCIIGTKEVDAKTTAKIYRASKICLNLMRPQNQKAHNMRSFEIPALGGFMLTDRTDAHLSIFEEGNEIACFEGVGELRDQVIKYLSADTARKEMTMRAREKVRNNHSYAERAKAIIGIVEKKQLKKLSETSYS